jgi:hypothetical protein
MLRVLEFLDSAIGLAKRLLELIDAHHECGGFVWIFRAAARNVGRRRRLVVEEIELRMGRRREREAGDERRNEARTRQ